MTNNPPKNQPRKHHYCPQFFLNNFIGPTENGSKLWVIDAEKKQVRPSIPKNEAHQRDFYRMELDDKSQDEFALEGEFSKIEAGAKDAIDIISQTSALPAKEQLEYLLSFVGLLAVRVPSFKSKIGDFHSDLAKLVLQMTYRDEASYQAAIATLKEKGQDFSEVPLTEARAALNAEDFEVEMHQNEFLKTMLESATTITDLLYKRNWTVIKATDGEFVTSDNPVSLNWIENDAQTWRSPGFGVIGTEVSIAIDKTTAIVGTFETINSKLLIFDKMGVATVNSSTIGRCERFIYSSSEDLIWRTITGELANREEFFKVFKK